MFKRVWAVTKKEGLHILRDKGTFVLVTFTPVLLLLLLAYALTAEIKHVPIALLDQDRSTLSRAFGRELTTGIDLDLIAYPKSLAEIELMLEHNLIRAAVILPPGFEETLLAVNGMPVQVIIDGTEPQSGDYALQHIVGRAQAFAGRVLATGLNTQGLNPNLMNPIDLHVRAWYNPDLKPRVDLIPGLLSMALALPGMSVALTLAREREHGTLEQLMASPIGKIELLLGKMLPYVISGLANVVMATVVAIVWFQVPFNGSFPLLLLLSADFFLGVLSLSMILGALLRTQAAALALSFLVLFIPGFFMSGVFFPLASMPDLARIEAMMLPGSHYAIITRGLFITGVGLEILWPYAAALFAMGVIYTVAAAVLFKKKLA